MLLFSEKLNTTGGFDFSIYLLGLSAIYMEKNYFPRFLIKTT